MSKVTVCLNNDNDEIGYNGQESDKANILKDNTEVYEINGPFFFGITNKFDDVMNILKNKSIKTRILRMRKVPFMDATAVHYLEQLFYKSQNAGIKVVISGINDQPLQLLKKTGLFDKIGENNIYRNFDKALENSEF
jgi:SulP family sulfate permease